jgi:hypothetical protein
MQPTKRVFTTLRNILCALQTSLLCEAHIFLEYIFYMCEFHLKLFLCVWVYYTILFYTILYYTILYYSMLYYTILYYTILYYTILYYSILFYTILYYTILYYTIHDVFGFSHSFGQCLMMCAYVVYVFRVGMLEDAP